MTQRPPNPIYTGVRKYIHETAGFRLWIPSDWTRFPMQEGHEGFMFGPYSETLDTSFTAEKLRLPFAVSEMDIATLRAGLLAGLRALPGIEIESQDESVTPVVMMVEARFTFLEGEARRKRWVRAVYTGHSQLLLIAQGTTPEEFEYWLPMFYNIMNTFELWPT